MQLIVDADDIDIKGTMSTIEQESLNEKFLANKIIDHLPDDVTSGNKENILKQDNIIPDLSENDSTDTDKEIVTSSDVILTNNLNEEESLNEAIPDAEDSENLEEVVSEIDSCKTDLGTVRDDPTVENIENTKEESQVEDNLILEKEQNLDDNQELGKEIETNIIIDDNNATNDECLIQTTDNDVELINKENEENQLDVEEDATLNVPIEEKELDVDENTTVKNLNEGKEEIEVDADEDTAVLVTNGENKENEVDTREDNTEEVTNVQNIENEEKVDEAVKLITEEKENKVDVDENDSVEVTTKENKKDYIDEDTAVSEINEENEEKQVDIPKNDAEEVTTEKKEQYTNIDEAVDVTEESADQAIIPKTDIDDKDKEMECSVIELSQTNTLNESNTPIEIDDEDEKSIEKDNSPNPEVLALNENMEVEELDEASDVQDLDDNMDVQELGENVQELDQSTQDKVISIEEPKSPQQDAPTVKTAEEPKRICKLSNNLDIFSDEEDDSPAAEPSQDDNSPLTEKCINIDDDDDIMLIDEVGNGKDNKEDAIIEDDTTKSTSDNTESVTENTVIENEGTESIQVDETVSSNTPEPNETDTSKVIEPEQTVTADVPCSETSEVPLEKPQEVKQIKKPLLPKHFIKTCKKNLADMTRDDLEDFCVLKIVESIVDRSNLGEIKSHLKNLTQTMDECKKKCLMLSKQNKDLQVVLKSVQEEQKGVPDVHVTPLKITRSVGMQVLMMVDKTNPRKKSVNGIGTPVALTANNINVKQPKPCPNLNIRGNKEKNTSNQQIPVPRLVPAVMAAKTNQTVPNNVVTKHVLINASLPNGVRNSPPVQKMTEKRSRSQAVTVDLTDDEPPAKLPAMQRGGVNQAMRVSGTPPNILQPQRFGAANMNSPRKVYIPISGAQAQNVRPGQTIMLKTVSPVGPRQRCPAPHIGKVPQNANQVRMGKTHPSRPPPPLPDAMKQYQPPNWKALPPAPDIKLSKVDNGIVISWRIDGYQEENHEEIASYQLYAYQETSSPASTALWKKIGDVKALPLPMACTLTQFMAGFKYFFAVRAVDVRTRFGPFSLPASILLLNKM